MVDPLTITVSITTLLATAAKVIKAAADLRSSYKDAAFMLSAIASECTVINTSLAIMQSLMIADLDILRSRMTESITATFEAALIGCTLTMSVVEEELHSLLATDDDGNLKARRVKYILEQSHLQEMLQQMRGQQMGISLLLQTYQLGTHAEVKEMIGANNDLLQKIADRGRKFYVESIHDSERCIGTAFSLHQAEDSNFEMSSTIDSRHFDFDDQITNAQAYRRALASLRQKDHLLGVVQTGETWETVPRHKVETTQALQANSEPKPTIQNSEPPAAGLERSISFVTSLVETEKRPNFTESIERVGDASGITSENNLVADLSTEERPESHVLGEYLLQIYGARKSVPTGKNTIGSCSSRTLTVDSNTTVGDGPQTSEDVRKLKFVMLGDSYSGKTYAMMKYMRGDTYGIPSAPTVGEEYTSDLWVDGRQYQIHWIDTPGQENYDSVRTLAYAGCHVAILVFAIDSPDSFANIEEKWAREIFQHQPLIPKILVGCKSDLRSHSNTIETLADISQKLVAKEDAEAFASCLGYDIKDLCTHAIYNAQMKYMECSAFTGEGIAELFEEAARLAVNSSVNRFTIDAALMLTNKKRKRLSDLFRGSQAREIDVRQV